MKEDDFTEALNAKDSQLAVLRVRVEETDQELQSTRKQIEEFHLERERSAVFFVSVNLSERLILPPQGLY